MPYSSDGEELYIRRCINGRIGTAVEGGDEHDAVTTHQFSFCFGFDEEVSDARSASVVPRCCSCSSVRIPREHDCCLTEHDDVLFWRIHGSVREGHILNRHPLSGDNHRPMEASCKRDRGCRRERGCCGNPQVSSAYPCSESTDGARKGRSIEFQRVRGRVTIIDVDTDDLFVDRSLGADHPPSSRKTTRHSDEITVFFSFFSAGQKMKDSQKILRNAQKTSNT